MQHKFRQFYGISLTHLIRFAASTAGRDTYICVMLLLCLSVSGALAMTMPALFGSVLPDTVCGTTTTIFTTVAADAPC